MVCLIIVCLLAEGNVFGWGKAHADPLADISRGCVRFFFAGMARRLVRPAMKGNTETHTVRGNEDGVARLGLCPAA